jgi:tetratricopeptide (TPR) repeat protein
MGNAGIVDKYIGDSIMAFFGAPSSTGQDALNSVTAGLEMQEALGEFNDWQRTKGRPPFFIGIGINHGKVTIGNIGSEKKMDYTVIGDMVNIASRVEGLTRYYHEPLLVSDSVYEEVHSAVPCRFVDKVAVMGRLNAISVYSAQREIGASLERVWKIYHTGIKYYYDRQFEEALRYFKAANEIHPGDSATERFIERCRSLIKTPPAKDWTGIVVMREK